MNLLSPGVTELLYLAAALCFILALKGLSSPRTARRGNLLGAAGAALAVVVVVLAEDLAHLGLIAAAVLLGSLLAVPFARRVPVTAMPQLVALFNGVGGAAAALVALLELSESGVEAIGWFGYAGGDGAADPSVVGAVGLLLATSFTVLVGSVSFAGSMVTFAKLQELMTTRPVVLPGARWLMIGTLLLAGGLAVAVVGRVDLAAAIALAVVGLAVGVLLVLPVGGADVPIVISLLNAFTGLAVAAGGFVLGNTLLLVAGTLVGASGTILTRAMATAMGRSLAGILFGALAGGSTAGGGRVDDRPVRSVQPDDVAILLSYARKVVVVPGYGLAVAQAQHTVHELAELLEARGVEVIYGVHAVAGRMPGHMNVLLAEANVPYEALREMDEVNPEFGTTDVVLVVGANDVVNPAARTDPSAPIYGMPILDVDEARQIVFLKRSLRPGFAGIGNELLHDPKTSLLFGDAKDSLTKTLAALKAL